MGMLRRRATLRPALGVPADSHADRRRITEERERRASALGISGGGADELVFR